MSDAEAIFLKELISKTLFSILSNLKAGDKVKVFGPFGEFFAKETPNEMVFVGGGAFFFDGMYDL